MNILIITELYPTEVNQSELVATHAIHFFAKDWVKDGHNVKVARVCTAYSKPLLFLDRTKTMKKHLKEKTIKLDDVTIQTILFKKYPRVDYSDKVIYSAYKKITANLNDEFNPDIIICHIINPALKIGKMLKQKYDIPLILVMHQSDITLLSRSNSTLMKFKYLLCDVDRLGFRSDAIKDKLTNLIEVNKKLINNSFVVSSGIEKKDIISHNKLENKLNKRPKNIFIACNLISLKNVDTLIYAFECIAHKYNLTLKIAGDGSERKKIERIINKSNAKSAIKMTGYISREQVLMEMEKSEIFVMVSSPETFGLVYVEALGKGCITIGSKGEGIDGIIKDGINGFLCKPKDVANLSEALEKIITMSQSQRVNIIRNSVKSSQNYTQEKLSEMYLDIIKSTIQH